MTRTNTRLSRACASLFTVALVCACSAGSESGEQPAEHSAASDEQTSQGASGTIIVGTLADRMNFDPQLSETGHQLQYLQPVYDTLLRQTPDGDLLPMLATEWSYNDDRTVLDLSLRDDVTFIDSEPFDAAAVKANLDRGTESDGPRASGLDSIDSVEVVDATAVRLQLARPDPILLQELASVMGMMISPAALDNADLDRNPVGTGPYVFQPDESSDGDRYVYELNPDYWDPSLQGVERIELVLMPDADARLNALRAGQIDMGFGLPVQVSDAEAAGLQVLSAPVNWRGINLADREGTLVGPLADVRVRQAMNHAIDRQAIVESIEFGMGSPATQIFAPDDPANIDPEGERFPYDPERARELLTEAGYKDGFAIDVPLTTFTAFAPAAEAIAGYLGDVGIELQLNVIDAGNQLIESWMDPEHPLAHVSYGLSHPAEMVRLFLLDDGNFNPFGTQLPGVREQLAEAAALPADEATAVYAEIAETATDQAWFLVTHYNDNVYLVAQHVTGVEMYPGQAVPSIYGWRVSE